MTTIIAEAGVNHNGELLIAKKLIDTAEEAGADYVKFQTFKAETLSIPGLKKADYQISKSNLCEDQFEMLKRLELSDNDYIKLVKYVSNKKIKIFSTSFDIKDTNFLASLGQNIFKIPSGEITNLPYLRHIASLHPRKVFLSTGMSTMQEVESALNVILNGVEKKDIVVMHCTSAYPAPFEDINLNAMSKIKRELNVEVGYSDHSLGNEISIAAVALGATTIEKHFTLDKNMMGPDHKASLNPMELKSYVNSIRKIEVGLGVEEKRLTNSESNNVLVARKSLVANKLITKGELFTKDNIIAIRPGNGISPMLIDSYIGKKANRSYFKYELIDKEI